MPILIFPIVFIPGYSKEEEALSLERIDIPKELLDTNKYCVTLGHKGKQKDYTLLKSVCFLIP